MEVGLWGPITQTHPQGKSKACVTDAQPAYNRNTTEIQPKYNRTTTEVQRTITRLSRCTPAFARPYGRHTAAIPPPLRPGRTAAANPRLLIVQAAANGLEEGLCGKGLLEEGALGAPEESCVLANHVRAVAAHEDDLQGWLETSTQSWCCWTMP